MVRTKIVPKKYIKSSTNKKPIKKKLAQNAARKHTPQMPHQMKKRRCRPGTVALREIRRFL